MGFEMAVLDDDHAAYEHRIVNQRHVLQGHRRVVPSIAGKKISTGQNISLVSCLRWRHFIVQPDDTYNTPFKDDAPCHVNEHPSHLTTTGFDNTGTSGPAIYNGGLRNSHLCNLIVQP